MNTYYHKGLYLQTVLQTPVFFGTKNHVQITNGIWEIPFSPTCTNIELVDNIYNMSMFCLQKKIFAFIFEELEFNYVKIISKMSTVFKKYRKHVNCLPLHRNSLQDFKTFEI